MFKERFFLFQFEDVTKLTGSKMCSHNSHLAKTLSGSSVLEERGRIHGYSSRVELGRVSDEIGENIWVETVTKKYPENAKKNQCYKPTSGWTDGLNNQAGNRVV